MEPYTVGLFGGGGLAREVAPIIRNQIADTFGELKFVVPSLDQLTTADSILEDEFLRETGKRKFCIAIADTTLREKLFHVALGSGATPTSAIAPSAIIYDTATVGDGVIIMPNAVVSADAHVGRGSIVNFNSYVAHDCSVDDFVTIGPGAVVAGNVSIGARVTVGAGTMIRNGKDARKVRINAGAVLGMGSVVLGDVKAGQTVAGCPAKPIFSDVDGV